MSEDLNLTDLLITLTSINSKKTADIMWPLSFHHNLTSSSSPPLQLFILKHHTA